MRFNVKFVGLVSLLAVIAACSAPPRQDTTAQPARAPAAQAAAPAPAAASATPTSSTSAAPSAVNVSLLTRGYKAEHYKGQTVYCRSEAVTGTLFKHKICLSERQILEQDKVAKETADAMSKTRTGPACMGPNCGG